MSDAEAPGDRAPVRVMLADDQRLVRESLATLLGLLDGIELVASAADGEEAIALAAEHKPAVVLMDLRMPRLDGIAATRRLRAEQPDVRVIALTTFADDQSVLGALRAGARGYLTKDAGGEDIRNAILGVAAGEGALDPSVQHHVVAALAESAASASEGPGEAEPARRPDASRGRGARADRRRADERGDRGAARRQPDDGQVTYQPPVLEGRAARPRAGGELRVPDGDRHAATVRRTKWMPASSRLASAGLCEVPAGYGCA